MKQCILIIIILVLKVELYSQSYSKLIDKAESYKHQGNFTEWGNMLLKAIKKYPNESETYFLYAEYSEVEGYSLDCKNYLEKAISIIPKAHYYERLANYYLKYKENYTSATDNYKKAINLDQNNVIAIKGLSDCYMKSNNLEDLKLLHANFTNNKVIDNGTLNYRIDTDYVKLNLKCIDQYFLDTLLYNELIIYNDIRKENKINYVFENIKDAPDAKQENLSTLSGKSLFIGNDQFLGEQDFHRFEATKTTLKVNNYKSYASETSNFLIDGNESNMTVYDILTLANLNFIKFPYSNCKINEIFGSDIFISYPSGYNTVSLTKFNALNGKPIFTINILSSGHHIPYLKSNNLTTQFFNDEGRFFEINKFGKIIIEEKTSSLKKFGSLCIPTIGGSMFIMNDLNTNLKLVTKNGQLLREINLDFKNWFNSGVRSNDLLNFIMHPSNKFVLFSTNYGVMMWSLVDNKIFLIDDENTAVVDRREYERFDYKYFRGIYFSENGNKLIVKKKGKYIIYSNRAYSSQNINMHSNFLISPKNEYNGELKDGLANGKGIMRFADNSVYEGSFKNGVPHGMGVMKYSNGEGLYEGEFINGKRNGKGVLYKMSVEDKNQTERYDCNWKNDKKNGEGYYINYNYWGPKDINGKYKVSYIFKGNWVEDLRHGKAEVYTTTKFDMRSDIHSRWLNEVEYNMDKIISKRVISEDVWWKNMVNQSIKEESISNENKSSKFNNCYTFIEETTFEACGIEVMASVIKCNKMNKKFKIYYFPENKNNGDNSCWIKKTKGWYSYGDYNTSFDDNILTFEEAAIKQCECSK